MKRSLLALAFIQLAAASTAPAQTRSYWTEETYVYSPDTRSYVREGPQAPAQRYAAPQYQQQAAPRSNVQVQRNADGSLTRTYYYDTVQQPQYYSQPQYRPEDYHPPRRNYDHDRDPVTESSYSREYRTRTRTRSEAAHCYECGITRSYSQGSQLQRLPVDSQTSYRSSTRGDYSYLRQFDGIRVRGRNLRNEALARRAPIWNAFITRFNHCAQGCVPVHYHAYGHRANASCHPTGEAIDLHAMYCNDGRVYEAINGGKFERMVNCMRGTGMKVIRHNGPGVTSGHHDHAHFSMTCNGGYTW